MIFALLVPYIAALSFLASLVGTWKCIREQKDPQWLILTHRVTVFSNAMLVILTLGVEVFLTGFTILIVCLATIDKLIFEKKRTQLKQEPTELIDFARSFVWLVVIIWFFKSFIYQPYRVPTGSLEPTVLPGDFLAVNQNIYGIRLPVIHTKLTQGESPKRGDIVVFRPPHTSNQIYVKRLIGLPGDKVSYINKKIYINGKPVEQEFLGTEIDKYTLPTPKPVKRYSEQLGQVKHDIYIDPYRDLYPSLPEITIPKDHYFMMGDNRDNSGDSRIWGPVPDANIIGKAVRIIMNIDTYYWKLRWRRIGTKL